MSVPNEKFVHTYFHTLPYVNQFRYVNIGDLLSTTLFVVLKKSKMKIQNYEKVM